MNDEIGTNWKLLSRLLRKCPHPALAIQQKTKMELFETVNVATFSLSLSLSLSLFFSSLLACLPLFFGALGGYIELQRRVLHCFALLTG